MPARPPRPATVVLALLAGAASAPAQETRWRIPERGAIEYVRQTDRLVLRRGPPLSEVLQQVVPTSKDGGSVWRYRECGELPPAAGWERPEFDDSGWPEGRSGFGGDAGSNELHRTRWKDKHVCLRTRFELGRRRPARAMLTVSHDDDVEVFLNGVRALRVDGFFLDQHHAVPRAALDALVEGVNVLAVRCTNTGGAQYIDVGLALFPQALPDESQYLAVMKGHADDQRTRDALFPSLRTPPLLFAGELDARQQYVTALPADLRDLPAWLAFDLRGRGGNRAVKATVPRVFHFGDLQVLGSVPGADEAGRQAFRLRVRSTEPALEGDTKRYVERNVLPHCRYTFEGTVEVVRWVDTARGAVRELETRLLGTVGHQDGREPRSLEIAETWKLARVRQCRDAEFREAVRTSIEMGARFLREKLQDTHAPQLKAVVSNQRSYPTGRLAMMLLALVKAGVGRDDPVVAAGFAELRRRVLVDTYSLAHAIMAVEAAYAPAGERDDLLHGRIDAPRRRQPSDDDRELLVDWVDTLMENVDVRTDRTELLRFSYVAEKRFDQSVNQYGLLGLYSAHLCGIDVDPATWRAAARHLLLVQDKGRDRIRLELTGHPELEERARGERKAPRRGAPVAAAGWGYEHPKGGDGVLHPRYGSMTAAGITGLIICRAALRDLGHEKDPVVPKIDAAIRSGFAWFAQNFSVRWNPGWIQRKPRHLYYYLYALERACELSGIALIQGRDWYHEGAMVLMSWQQADGSFAADLQNHEPIDRTAMAVLFLVKAALPVYTLR